MRFLRFAALGAALTYFFDPQNGRLRRNTARDRVLGFFRRRGREAARAGRGVAAEAYGLKQKATHLREQPKTFDDQTLKAKIESEVFRPAGAPKGDVDVNVARGVVYLRGQVDGAEVINDLEQRVRSVQGVSEVENLLHLPGTKAPMHQG
ncbi:MAG TPA: BON domain-containing protein [Gaiellaceae bacterium]|jgi:osmotically-inducible protein OsmY|nr:BON domain-containing protein [Gaiellaceae bacterium]